MTSINHKIGCSIKQELIIHATVLWLQLPDSKSMDEPQKKVE